MEYFDAVSDDQNQREPSQATDPKHPVPDCLATGMNETQAAVATMSIPGPLAGKYYAMMGLAMHEALSAGGAPPPALAGTCRTYKRAVTSGPLTVHQSLLCVCWAKVALTSCRKANNKP
jgi:hypothetical protein